MLIQGNPSDSTAGPLVSFLKAKEDEDCVELDIRDICFDFEETSAFVDTIQSKIWKSIKITSSHGMINDAATACMTSNNLESFHLQTSVNDQTAFAIGYGIKYSNSLLHLSLSVDIDYPCATLICKSLARNTWLQTLNLNASNIQSTAIPQLGFALRLNRTLRTLSFDSCYLEDEEVSSILMALQDHPALKCLSLQQNSCHTQGMQAIACLLNYNDLEELDLGYLVRKKKTETQQAEDDTPATEETAEENSEEKEEGETEEEEKDEEDDGSTGDATVDEEAGDDNAAEDEKSVEQPDEASEEERKVSNKSLKVLRLAGNG